MARVKGALNAKKKHKRVLKLAKGYRGALYVTASPCIECAKLIIQAGIKRVVYHDEYRITDGLDLLRRAGIEVVKYDSID